MSFRYQVNLIIPELPLPSAVVFAARNYRVLPPLLYLSYL